jgi:hypothetical protein
MSKNRYFILITIAWASRICSELYITYSNNKTDGLGGQYSRIHGIVCIGKYFDNVTYVHTKITQLGHIKSDAYVQKVENYLNFNKHFKPVETHKYDRVVELYNPTLDDFNKERNSKGKILMIIVLPYTILQGNKRIYTDAMPYLTSILQPLSRQFYHKNIANIALHVKRGDVTEQKHPTRWWSLESVTQTINNANKRYRNCNIFIFTESADQEFSQILKNNKNVFLKSHEDDELTTFDHFVFADVLIMGISSFSTLAGFYNSHGEIYTHHSRLNSISYFDKLPTWKFIENIF